MAQNTKKARIAPAAKWSIVAVSLLLVAVLFFVAQQKGWLKPETALPDGDSVTIGLSVTLDGSEVVYDEAISAEKGKALIEAMETALGDELVYSDGAYGAYITSICGYAEDAAANKYWMYTVNGESAMTGASEYIPEEGDAIVFDLSELTW